MKTKRTYIAPLTEPIMIGSGSVCATYGTWYTPPYMLGASPMDGSWGEDGPGGGGRH